MRRNEVMDGVLVLGVRICELHIHGPGRPYNRLTGLLPPVQLEEILERQARLWEQALKRRVVSTNGGRVAHGQSFPWKLDGSLGGDEAQGERRH